MYYNMKSYKENQCVIISGESGAGKTEAAKRIMQYIASVSGESSSNIQKIKDMVLATNPLLESFGCAKTLRNNNSSRHGKYLQIQFNAQGEPIGANITNYLLEKARVVGQIQNERNFHIFYQFTKGASQAQRDTYGIQTPDQYSYTKDSKCTTVEGIDDIADFKETIKAMEIIGLHQGEQDQILRLLASILWIGNVDFVENDHEQASIRDLSVPNFIAYLLDVDAQALEKALTQRIVETSRGGRRGSVYEVPLNAVQAKSVRDALAKAIYNNLFDWIVERVNQSLDSPEGKDKTIGILDIYGFEIFENNSFEQICINYVNEKLQQIFIQLTLKTEQEEYVKEQITWTPIKYFNNKIVCDLIEEKRPPGIFAALNDACATAHADVYAADQSFAQRLGLVSSNPHFEQRQNKFLIKHYAGDVYYDINGMTEKNKDQLLKDLLVLISKSGNQFLTSLFPEQVDTNSRRRPPTASDKIKQSANELMHTLSLSQPSYIRTIKPNQTKIPSDYDTKMVLHQVKYLGLHENVRIRRAGFAYRQTYEKFTERFYLLSGKTSYAGDFIWKGDSRSATIEILKDSAIPTSEYQLGTTKVFIKTPETLFALEHMRDMYWHNMAARIQRAWRRHLKYKADCAIKIQRAWRAINGGKEFIELRDKGHKILNGRKERRRMSLNGYRRFLGDYLACNDTKSAGGFMARAVHINEKVIFSMTGDILFSKFGRSSMRVPRKFVLTASKFMIIAEQIVNHQLSFVVERSVPVSSIKYIAMSNLCDDWVVLSIQSQSEPDLFFSCVFKTELVTMLSKLRPGIDIRIAATVQYNKKPGKLTTVKFQKDPNVQRDDFYKSGTVHVQSGMPPNSVSDPTPKKPRAAGSTAASRPKPRPQARPAASAAHRIPPAPPAAQPLPGHQPGQQQRIRMPEPFGSNNAQTSGQQRAPHLVMPSPFGQQGGQQTPAAVPAQRPVAAQQRPATQHPASLQPHPIAHNIPASRPQSKAAPPPPPTVTITPPAPPAQPTYKALYDFSSSESNQLSIKQGELVILVKQGDEGWCLAKRINSNEEGWTPFTYLEQVKTAAAAPPPPPAVRPKKKAPTPPVKSKPASLQGSPYPQSSTPQPQQQQLHQNGSASPSPSLASGLAEALKQKKQNNNSLAGGLADALKARTGRRDSLDSDDDDW